MNTILISGNLTAEPKIISTTSSNSFATFTVGYNERYKTKEDEVVEHTSFFDCVLFKSSVLPYLQEHGKQGAKVHVSGKARIEKYETDGVKKKAFKIIVDNISF